MSLTMEGTETKVMPFGVRPLRAEDIHQCERIERDAFPSMFPPTSFRRELSNSRASYLIAWTRDEIAKAGLNGAPAGHASNEIRNRALVGRLFQNARKMWNGQGSSLEKDELIAGFVGTCYMVDEAHIVAVGVSREFQGRGIGELLFVAAIEQIVTRGVEVVTLEVRPSNGIATNLYRKYGFKERGVRKAYYADDGEDALIMTTDPIHGPSFQGPFRELEQEHRHRWGHSERVLS